MVFSFIKDSFGGGALAEEAETSTLWNPLRIKESESQALADMFNDLRHCGGVHLNY